MRHARLLGAAIVLALTASVYAQPRPATIDDVFNLEAVGSPAISPDGSKVIYTVRDWQPSPRDPKRTESRTRIWIVPTTGGEARPLTFGDRADTQPQWSPDGRHISFVSSRGPDRGEPPAPQLYVMRADGGEATKVTDGKEGVTGYSWAPDSKSIAFVTRRERTAEEQARLDTRDDARVYEGEVRYSDVWVVDVESGRVTRALREEEKLVVSGAPQWSPDGRTLAIEAKPTTLIRDSRSDVYLLPWRGQPAAPERITQNPGPDGAPRWSPDGRWIAFISEINNAKPLGDGIPLQSVTLEHLMLYDIAARTVKDASSRTFDTPANTPLWSADSSTIYFTAGRRTYNEVFAYDVSAGTYRALTNGRIVSLGSRSKDGRAFALTMESAAAPADVYVADAAFKSFTQLTTTNPQTASLALGTSEVITWKSTDGKEIEGVLLTPVGYQAGQRVPLLVVAHGGPTGAYTNNYRLGGLEAGQVLASQGWAVLYPNVRGSTNYGEAFMRANIPDWGGGDWRDLMSGVDAVIARGIADPDRLALIGWSYGGYMTAWGITQTTRFKAAMVGAGITNVWSMYGTNDIPNYLGTFFGGIPGKETQALYLERSAMSHVDKVTTPTLILHGASDERVPTGQALELHRALKDRGKVTELVFYPREGHGLQEYQHQRDRLERIHAWITKYTLGSAVKRLTVQ